jgi:DNA-binding protein HU-beta
MNKVQLAEKMREMHLGKGVDTTKKHAEEVIDFVFESITQSLKGGEEVNIAGFGGFEVKQRKPRTGRNPRTGEVVQVPATKVPKFRPSKALKEAVK